MSELLGAASFPSGDLLVIDFGLLSMWSGDRVPVLADGLASPDEVARAEREADFEIVGPDAAEVASRIDLVALTGRYAFDMSDGGESIAACVAGICREAGLEATL